MRAICSGGRARTHTLARAPPRSSRSHPESHALDLKAFRRTRAHVRWTNSQLQHSSGAAALLQTEGQIHQVHLGGRERAEGRTEGREGQGREW